MKIADIINRIQPAPAWEYGEKIPWNDPEFSERMLQNHLSQDHDWASRREELIAKQISWLTSHLPEKARILDLACGPGFYTHRLAQFGHDCVGVDFSPASIRYAREQAEKAGLKVEYVLSDIRKYQPEGLFDCVMFVFGEFNVFQSKDAAALLALSAKALKPGGLFAVEVHTFEAVEDTGRAPSSWWSCQAGEGVLSAQPHVCLQENSWDENKATATSRYYILDQDGQPSRMYCSSMTGYTTDDYKKMFEEAGLGAPETLDVEDWPVGAPFVDVMCTLSARKI